MPMRPEEIRNRLGEHPETSITKPKRDKIREGYIAFMEFLNQVLPDGRPKSKAFTELQESFMWANFSIDELSPAIDPTIVPESR